MRLCVGFLKEISRRDREGAKSIIIALIPFRFLSQNAASSQKRK